MSREMKIKITIVYKIYILNIYKIRKHAFFKYRNRCEDPETPERESRCSLLVKKWGIIPGHLLPKGYKRYALDIHSRTLVGRLQWMDSVKQVPIQSYKADTLTLINIDLKDIDEYRRKETKLDIKLLFALLTFQRLRSKHSKATDEIN